MNEVWLEIIEHAKVSDTRFGDFTSTHEAMGVMLEEWNELQSAVQANKIESIREEAIDLAAVCYRLAMQCRSNKKLKARSVK